jgi:phage terminase Nu1 subunit (DNA packaging protein)
VPKLVSRAELADILGLSPNRVSELKVAGVIQAESSRFDALDCARCYVAYRRDKASERAQSGDREALEAKLRKYRSNLEKDRNRLCKLQEEALSIADTQDTHEFIKAVLLFELRELPERISDRISKVRDMPSMSEEIEKECYAALNNMKDKLTQEADSR